MRRSPQSDILKLCSILHRSFKGHAMSSPPRIFAVLNGKYKYASLHDLIKVRSSLLKGILDRI